MSRSSIVFLCQFCGFLSREEGLILCELLPSDKYNNPDKFLDCAVFQGKEERKERTNIKTAYSYKVEIKLYNSSSCVEQTLARFRLKKQDFTTLPDLISFTFSFSTKFNNQFFRRANGSLVQDLFKYLIMLINHTSPKCPEVYTVNNPCSCYIDTCSKKLIQSDIRDRSKIRGGGGGWCIFILAYQFWGDPPHSRCRKNVDPPK